MNPLTAGFVPYVSRFPAWIDRLLLQFDYFWFAALLGWSLALVLWWWHPRRATSTTVAWAWLPWSAGAGVLAALIEFALLNSNAGPPPKTALNIALGLLPLLAAAGWCWQAAIARSRGTRVLAALTAVPLVAIGVFRYHNPLVGGWLTAGASFLALIPWWRKPGANAWSRAALVLAALTPAFAAVGPLAVKSRFYQPFLPQNVAQLWAGAYQALAAGVALVLFTREVVRGLTPNARRQLWRECRPFLIGGALWAAVCLTVGGVIAHDQLMLSHRLTLEQIYRVAIQLDPHVLAATLGPEFQLDPQSLPKENLDAPVLVAEAPHLATGVGEPLYRVLSDVARGTRGGLKAVSILTIRDGWLVVALSSNRFEQPGRVRLARPTFALEKLKWDQRAEIVESPVSFNAGSMDLVRFPLTGPDGAMLGWLEFANARGGYAPFRTRTAPFLSTVLGFVIAALFFVQKQNFRERESALRAAAVAAEAARAKGEFLAKVSHELRTPLQSILGYGEMLRADVAAEPGRARLAALQRQSQLMLRVVNDLIDLHAVETGVFRFVERPVALGALVQQTVESLRPRAEQKALQLDCVVAPGFPAWLRTDAERLRQIVLNVVGNAVKFTERGGVHVTLSVTGHRDSQWDVELAVRDTGPGIAAEDQPKLFQSFARLAPTAAAEGSGLGLALVAALCRSAGGSIEVQSDGRSGSCFRVRLPLALAAAPDAPPDRRPADLQGRRVLIADDNALVRELFAAYLHDHGARCDLASNGAEALAHAETTRYDAIVLDIAMPGVDGLETARRLRAQPGGADLHIVGVSAHAAAAERERAQAAGMDVFLVKPVDLPDLAAALSTGSPEIAVSPQRAATQVRLQRLFRENLPAEVAAMADALARADWPALKTHAHHLKSSASVVGDQALYDACTAVEEAAEQRTAPAAAAAWKTCEEALRRWRGIE